MTSSRNARALMGVAAIMLLLPVVAQAQEATVGSTAHRGAIASSVQLTVRLPSGKSITLNVDSSDTIEALKAKIADKTGIAASQQRLGFGGKSLDGGRLADHNVGGGATITLTTRP